MKKITLFALSLVCSSALASTEVARVNDKIITSDQLNAAVNDHAQAGGVPMSRREILEELIRREVAIQEARRLKVEQDPMVSERLNTTLYYAFIEKRLGDELNKVKVTEGEAKSWYDSNPEIRTSHIFIALNSNATPEDEKAAINKLNQIAAEIRSGKISFAEAAQKNSEDATATLGGDMEYRLKNRLDPAYYRAASRLGKPGDISVPVRSAFGVHLIRLTGKHTYAETNRSAVRQAILEERRKAIVSQFVNGLKSKAKISVSEKSI